MPTYYIGLDGDNENKTLISNLIGTLEKLNGIVVFDAIGVVLEPGSPEAELMRSLARDVIPERVTFSELIKPTEEAVSPEARLIIGPDPRTGDLVLPHLDAKVADDHISLESDGRSSNGDAKKRKCLRCGDNFTPASNRQLYCSKHCRIAAQASVKRG